MLKQFNLILCKILWWGGGGVGWPQGKKIRGKKLKRGKKNGGELDRKTEWEWQSAWALCIRKLISRGKNLSQKTGENYRNVQYIPLNNLVRQNVLIGRR